MSWTTYWYTYFNTSGYALTAWQTSATTSTTFNTSATTSWTYSVNTSSTGTYTTSWTVSTTKTGTRSTSYTDSTAVAISTTTSWNVNTQYSRSTTTSWSATTSWTTSWTTSFTTTFNTTYSRATSHVTSYTTSSSWNTSRATTTSWTTTLYTNTMLATSHNTTTSWTTTFETSQQTTTLVPMQRSTNLTPYQVTTTLPQQFQTNFYITPPPPYDAEHDWDLADFSGTLTEETAHNPGLGLYIRSGMAMSDDGTKLIHVMEYPTNTVREYNVSTPYDLTSIGSAVNSFDGPEAYSGDIKFYEGGTLMLMTVTSNDRVVTFELTTPFDISTRTNQKSYASSPRALGANFIDRGNALVIFDYTSSSAGSLTKFSLSTAYDLSSTLTSVQSLSLSASTLGVSDLRSYGGHMNADGSQYVGACLTGTPNLYKINFATPGDLASTKTYSAATVSGRPGSPCVINSGTQVIWGDETTSTFRRFNLT